MLLLDDPVPEELLELDDPVDEEPPPELDDELLAPVELLGGVELLLDDVGGRLLLEGRGGTPDELDEELIPELDELPNPELLDEPMSEELLDGRNPLLEEDIHDELLNHPLEDTGPTP